MKHLPIDVLRSFVTIVELGGYTQAGEVLGRSQPAISLQIKRLEEMLNRKLLTRQHQQLQLTDAGKTLFDYAKKMLVLNDEAVSLFDQNALSGKVRLGIPSEFATALLPSIVSRFTKTYPNITLEVTSSLSQGLKINQDDYDLVLALTNDSNDQQVIRKDKLVWVAGNGYKLTQPLQLVVAPDGCIYRQRMKTALSKSNHQNRIVYTNPDLTGITAALNSHLGITALANSTVPKGLKVINHSSLPSLGDVGIYLFTNPNSRSSACEKLSEYLIAGLSEHN